MRERPIIFSGQMVRVILEDRKTMTRRPIKPQSAKGNRLQEVLSRDRSYCEKVYGEKYLWGEYTYYGNLRRSFKCPYGQPGDRLWVREAFHIDTLQGFTNCPSVVHYKADPDIISQSWAGQWKPSIHMPRWASRITLEITGIKVERLQDITEEDVEKEGTPNIHPNSLWLPRYHDFKSLWNSIYTNFNRWEFNPWVWVIEFKRIATNLDGGIR